MTDRFNKFLNFLLKLEGGFSNHKADKGGATSCGVTQNTYSLWLKKNNKKDKPVKNITHGEVEAIYKEEYYNKVNYIEDELSHYLLFDLAVNSGIGAVKTCIQSVDNPNSSDDILKYRRQKYANIVKADPTQQVFAEGWNNRLKRIVKEYKVD